MKVKLNEGFSSTELEALVSIISLIAMSKWIIKKNVKTLDDKNLTKKLTTKIRRWYYRLRDPERYNEYEEYIAKIKETLNKINKKELVGLIDQYQKAKDEAIIGGEQDMGKKLARYQQFGKVLDAYIKKNLSSIDDLAELYGYIKNDQLPEYSPSEIYTPDRSFFKQHGKPVLHINGK